MSDAWWYLSDVVRKHNETMYKKSGLHSVYPCRREDYKCKYCGQLFSTYANCVDHEKSCADWERISLPCNSENERIVIYRNRQTGQFTLEQTIK